jgi:membrane associated rhomboid family serine protease
MTPWVTRIIIANVVMFILSSTSPRVTEMFMLVPALALVRPWTLVTYMFLHGGVSHILFNMLGLFFFGPRLEEKLGGKQFLWLYFLSGLVGGALSFFFTPYAQIVGASGAVFGVFLGFAYYWPREIIYIWGVIPVQARILVAVMTALSLFGGFGGSGDGIAHFAHLGGFLGGFLYIRWIERRSVRSEPTVALNVPGRADLERWLRIPRENLHEVNRDELDRIRKKMDTAGVGNLTPDEITFLNRFSS